MKHRDEYSSPPPPSGAVERLSRFAGSKPFEGESGNLVYPGGIFCIDNPNPFYDDLREVLSALRSSEASITALVEALRPFAEACHTGIRLDDPDNDKPALARVSDYRRAATALLALPRPQEGGWREAVGIAEAEYAHWLKEAAKHKRPSGRNSDHAARDLERAKVARRIVDKLNAAAHPPIQPAPRGDGGGE